MADRQPKAPVRRGRCDRCGLRFPLRRDGSVRAHPDRSEDSGPRAECPGSSKPARPVRFGDRGLPDCGDCLMYFWGPDGPKYLTEAIYSTAIESGRDPLEMFRAYVAAYHDGDHKEMT